MAFQGLPSARPTMPSALDKQTIFLSECFASRIATSFLAATSLLTCLPFLSLLMKSNSLEQGASGESPGHLASYLFHIPGPVFCDCKSLLTCLAA